MPNNLAFLITCITDMHVGSGDSNYGYIDKTVQRDAITHFPTIFSSSLKGALREHLTQHKGLIPEDITTIFGSEHATEDKDMTQGEFRFFGADLLALPIRNSESSGVSFYRATCAQACVDLTTKLTRLESIPETTVSGWNWPITEPNSNATKTEFGTGGALYQSTHIGDNAIHLSNEDFRKACKNLPVRARNQLENGESKNLWYEEFVPRETRFIFCVRCGENSNLAERFKNTIDGKVIQFGANASVGMGFCLINKLG